MRLRSSACAVPVRRCLACCGGLSRPPARFSFLSVSSWRPALTFRTNVRATFCVVCVSSAGSMKEAVTGWVDKSPSWVVDSPNRPVALFRSALTPPDGVEKHCIA